MTLGHTPFTMSLFDSIALLVPAKIASAPALAGGSESIIVFTRLGGVLSDRGHLQDWHDLSIGVPIKLAADHNSA